MGLLRKAAGAGAPQDAETVPPAHPAPEIVAVPAPKRGGLLRRSISALVADGPAAVPQAQDVEANGAQTSEAQADWIPSPLSVELVPEPETYEEALPPEPSPSPAPTSAPVAHAPAVVQATAARPAEEIVREIITSVQALADGVELPSELFTFVASKLSIEKGALLLFDPLRLVYAPWASLGYDQTTLHRMRIPLGASESFNALANGLPIALADTASIAAYQSFFSAREFSSITQILLTPFIADGKLVGVLLLTRLASPFDGDEPLLQCLSAIAEIGSARVQTARSERLAKAGVQGMRAGESPEEEASSYLAAFGASGTKILFLSLSLEEYGRRIISSHAHLDPFRLHEDLHYFLGAFVSDLGKAIPIRQGVYIVALQDFDATQLDLFLHQLALFLHGLFGGNNQEEITSGLRVQKTMLWPTEDGDVGKLLEFLSS
jgi:hypothetical protein